jgi:ADP-ribose pyrophosphatase YjhB (NUDIX family)
MYVLPGGGQEQYEPLTDAVAREVREESGYEVAPGKLVAVCEQIFLSERIRENYPDYAHRVHHIFLCALKDSERGAATEPDLNQEGCVWMTLEEADGLDNLYPKSIRGKLAALAETERCEFLGCEFVEESPSQGRQD